MALINPLGYAWSRVKCVEIEIPSTKIGGSYYDKIFFEYRSTKQGTSKPDESLNKLRDGTDQTLIEGKADALKVDIDGILVRMTGQNTGTTLIDANPNGKYTTDGEYSGQFIDSFLNLGNSLTFGAPLNLELVLM